MSKIVIQEIRPEDLVGKYLQRSRNRPTVHQSPLMVKGGGSDVTLQCSDPWDSPNITAQQVPAEHVAVNPQDLESMRDGYVIVSRR